MSDERTLDENTLDGPRSASSGPAPAITSDRYRVRHELGRGGVGFVYLADDLHAGRVVALKVLNPKSVERPDLVLRFVGEARITAQLDHPGIVPVYDIGNLATGEPYYSMRVVRGNSLAQILRLEEKRREYSLSRLLGILIQVCRAVGFAHQRGVVHRDLKPENILVGEHGETYVTDWGLARALLPSEATPLAKGTTRDGMVLGTPGYISPEQITDATSVSPRSDIFSAGVVLYEMLTGALPFDHEELQKTLLASLLHEPKKPRERVPRVPIFLEELCLECLKKDPGERPQTLEAVAVALEEYLEGTRERERQRAAAREQVGRARTLSAALSVLEAENARLEREAQRLAVTVEPHEDSPAKRAIWELEGRAEHAALERAGALGQMIADYAQALEHEPSNADAHAGLAAIYYQKILEAEADRDPRSRIFYERLLKRHDDGSFVARLLAPAKLSLESTPRAQVFAQSYTIQQHLSVLGEPRELGTTTLEHELASGSWLLTLRAPGYAEVKLPCSLAPSAVFQAKVRLYSPHELGAGFIHIPAGWTVIGGDRRAPGTLPKQRVWVEDFALAEKPVTYAEYSEFRPGLERMSSREADIENYPALGVSWFDAIEYCAWKSQRDGVTYRLPYELEWEKAARGADGRAYPWGDRFDPIFCKSRESRPGIPAPEPLGAFPADLSPYGIRDLAGSTREWTADVLADSHDQRLLRGGGWNSTGHSCRAAARFRISGRVRRLDFGFRLAKSLVP